jgi:hypothetical protein
MSRTEKILIIDFLELPKKIQTELKECYCLTGNGERYFEPFIYCAPNRSPEGKETYAYTLTRESLNEIKKKENKYYAGNAEQFLLEEWLLSKSKAKDVDLCVRTILIDMVGMPL